MNDVTLSVGSTNELCILLNEFFIASCDVCVCVRVCVKANQSVWYGMSKQGVHSVDCVFFSTF